MFLLDMESKKRRILVVGAGPAGVSAAYFLKHYDALLDVELVERLTEKKYQVYHDMCGEAVSQTLFKDISPLRPKGIVGEIHSMREYWPGNITITTKLTGRLIDRNMFLKSIVKEFLDLGGKYTTGSVSCFEQGSKDVKVKINDETRNFDYVIAADGPNSLIRKILGVPAKTNLFTQYIVDQAAQSGVLVFKYDEKYLGDYLWEFPHEGKVKIGYPAIFKPEKLPKNILTKQSKYICYGGLPQYVFNNILLIGDAAGQTNAITKGGIHNAMVAGRHAAEAIAKNNPEEYNKKWKASPLSLNLYLEIYEKLQSMKNEELTAHILPFQRGYSVAAYIKSNIFFRKYLKFYRAYYLANIHGW